MVKVFACGVWLALIASTTLAATPAPSIVLYRYVDSRGVKVLDSQGVPPEYVGQGYEVLNQQGRVIQVVPRAPTADELHKQQADQAKAAADAELMRKYPSLDELDHARASRLSELDSQILIVRNSEQTLQLQQQNVQGQAAEQERAGREVPQALLEQLKKMHADHDDLESKVKGYQQTRLKADQDFAALRVRLAAILGQ